MRVAMFAVAMVLALGLADASITKSSGYALGTTWNEQRHYTYKRGTTPVSSHYRNSNQFLTSSSTPTSDDMLMLFSEVLSPADSTGTYCQPDKAKSNNYAQYSSGAWAWASNFDEIGKYYICVCSSVAQATLGDDCAYGGSASSSIDAYDFHFDNGPGFVHVIDSHSLTYVGSAGQGLFFTHYTVMANWQQAGGSAPVLRIPFISSLDATADKFYFAKATATAEPRCGFSLEDVDTFGKSYIAQPASGAAGTTTGTMIWNIPAAGMPTSGLSTGKSLICFCDSTENSNVGGCVGAGVGVANYGAQVGIVHVVQSDVLRHVTIPRSSSSVKISLMFDTAIGSQSKAQFLADITEVDTTTTQPWKFGACGSAHSDITSAFVDGSTSSTALGWATTLAVGELLATVSNTDGTTTGTARVCVCNSDVEQSTNCATTVEDTASTNTVASSAEYYGAQWGYIHKINVDVVGLHYTFLKTTSQSLSVTFDATASMYASTAAHSPNPTQSGLPSASDRLRVSTECGKGAADSTVVTDINSDTSGVSQDVSAAKVVTVSGFSGVSVGKKLLCFCDAESWDVAYTGVTGTACGTQADRIQHFGAGLGFVHVVDSATVSQHISIAKGTSNGRQNGEINLWFNTGFANAADRVMLVQSDKDCGIDQQVTTHVGALSSIATGGLTYQVSQSSIAATESLMMSGVTLTQAALTTQAKTKVCYCDSSVESAFPSNAGFTGCDSQNPVKAYYGAEVGYLHVVDVDMIPAHYTIGIGREAVSSQFITATFLTTPDVYGDKFYLANRGSDVAENRCGSADPLPKPYDIENELVAMEQTHLTVLVDASDDTTDLMDETTLAKIPMCYCDASVEGQSLCDSSDAAAFKAMSGAWLGYVHVTDMHLPSKLHWTLGQTSAQTLNVVFQGNTDVSQDSRLMAVGPDKRCGVDSSETAVFPSDLSAGQYSTSKTQLTRSATTDTLSLTNIGLPKSEGKVKLCYCDKNTEFNGVGDPTSSCDSQYFFGAWLGYLHVVRAQEVAVHHTIAINKVNALVYSTINVEFLTVPETADGFTVAPIEYWGDNKDDIDYNAGSCGTYDIADLPNNMPDDSDDSPPGTGRGYPNYATTTPPTLDGTNLQFELKSAGRSMVAICYCDNNVEGEACGVDSTNVDGKQVRTPTSIDLAFDTRMYGAQVGFLHSVPMVSSNFHSTIFVSAQADQKFSVIFDDRATVPVCTSDSGTVTCDDWSNNEVRLVSSSDDCALGDAPESIVTDPANVGYSLSIVDNKGSASMEVHPRTSPATSADDNQEVAFELTDDIQALPSSTTTNQHKLKICFCDYKLEGSSCASQARFGAHVGFLHIIDAPKSSFTVALGASVPTLKVSFTGTVSATTEMRTMLVKSTEYCGYKYVDTVIEDTTTVASLRSVVPTVAASSNEFMTYALSLTSGSTTAATKSRVCVCDNQAEGAQCDTSDDTMYGLQMGWLHLVDVTEVGVSYTIPKTNAAYSLNVEFLRALNTPNSATAVNDQLLLIDWDQNCGYSEITSRASELGVSAASTVDLNSNGLSYDMALTPNFVGRVHLCYCDLNDSVGGLQSADNPIERSSRVTSPTDASCDADSVYWHFGADLGQLYIIDVQAVPLQYTIAKNTDQVIAVTFQTKTVIETGDRFMAIEDKARCGVDAEKTDFASDLNTATIAYGVGDVDNNVVGAGTLEASGVTGAEVGVHTLCFCDSSIIEKSCSDVGDYGAQLGRLHVVDLDVIPLHVTVKANSLSDIAVKFLTSTGGEALDRFRAVGVDDDCGTVSSSAGGPIVTEANLRMVVPVWDATKNTLTQTVDTTTLISKQKLCFCDFSAEGASDPTDCQNDGDGMHGAQLGYLHSVDITGELSRHYSVGKTTGQTYSVQFAAGHGTQTNDRFVLASRCGHAFTTAIEDSLTQSQTEPALTADMFTVGVGMPVEPAKTMICYCDENVEKLDGTTQTVSVDNTNTNSIITTVVTATTGCSGEADHYGASLGYMHIVDVTTVMAHWTVAKKADQSITVDFLTAFPDSWGAVVPETTDVVVSGVGTSTVVETTIITTIDASESVPDRMQLADLTTQCGTVVPFTTNIDSLPGPLPVTTGTIGANGALGLSPLTGKIISKDALCYCDASAEGLESCNGADFEHFGALLGEIHVVALLLDPPIHVTLMKTAGQTLTVAFTADQNVVSNDRLRGVEQTDQCGAPDASSLTTVDLATIPTTSWNVDQDHLSVQGVSAASVGKARLCYCDLDIETLCGVSDVDNYGADLGYLHVVDLGASGGHFTIAVAPAQDLTVEFQSSDAGGLLNDRLRALVFDPTVSGCGKNTENTISLASLDTAVYSNPTGTDTLVASLQSTPTVVGKSLLCLCDFDVESACSHSSHYGAEIGILHIVDVAAQRMHFTIGTDPAPSRRMLGLLATKTFDITFKTTADSSDMYKILPITDSCTTSTNSVGPSLTSSTGLVTTLSVEGLSTPQNYKICLCDFSVETDCNDSVDSGIVASDFGIDLGFLHVVDIGKMYHYTIYNSKDQSIDVTFRGIASSSDQFSTVLSSSECGTPQEEEHVIAVATTTADGYILSTKSASEETMAVGETRLCFCDADTYSPNGCLTEANFGAQVATVHVAVPLVYPSIQTNTISVGENVILNITFTMPAEHSAEIGAIIETVLPSGWGDGSNADVNTGISVESIVVDLAGSTTTVTAAQQGELLGADVHTHCGSANRQCISWEVGTNDIVGGSLVTFLVKSTNDAFKVPAAGAISNDGAIYVYRAGSMKEIIETFVEPVDMPDPKDAMTMYATAFELHDTMKSQCDVSATVTYQAPLDIEIGAQFSVTLPEGFYTSGIPTVTQVTSTLEIDQASVTVEQGKIIKFSSTSRLEENTVYQLLVSGICNRAETYEESKDYESSSAQIEIADSTGVLKGAQSDGIWPVRVTDGMTDSVWRLSSSVVGSSTIVSLTINVPEYVTLENGYVKAQFPVGWTAADVKVDGVSAEAETTEDGLMVTWNFVTDPMQVKQFTITGLTVGNTLGAQTAMIWLVEKERLVSEKSINGVMFQLAHKVPEVIVTKDLVSELPAVTAAIESVRTVFHSTVTASTTNLEIRFDLPTAFGIPKLQLGDKCAFAFPAGGNWLNSFNAATLTIQAGGSAFTDVAVVAQGDTLEFEVPGDIVQGTSVVITPNGMLTVPIVGASSTGGSLNCMQKWTADETDHFTTVTTNNAVNVPEPTRRMTEASISLTNTRGGLFASAEHPNHATIEFTSTVPIPVGAVVVVRFPDHDRIDVAGASLVVNGQATNRMTSFDAPSYAGQDLQIIHPSTVAFSPLSAVVAGNKVTVLVESRPLDTPPTYGVNNRPASETEAVEALIEVFVEDTEASIWVLTSVINQSDNPGVTYPTIYPEFSGAWMYPSTTVQGSTDVTARVSFDLGTLTLVKDMVVSYKFPKEWGAGQALPTYTISRSGRAVIDASPRKMDDGSHVVSWIVGTETITGQVTFDVKGLNLPECAVGACPGVQNDGWVQVLSQDRTVVLSETVTVPALDVTQLISDAKCMLSDPRVGNPARVSYVDLTVEFTTTYEVTAGTKLRITLPDEWYGVSSGQIAPVMNEPAGHSMIFLAKGLNSYIDVQIDAGAVVNPATGQLPSIASGTMVSVTLLSAISVPSNSALVAQTPENAKIELFSTPIATHADYRVVRASQVNYDWPPVAARIVDETTHAYFTSTVEGHSGENGKFEFAVPEQITIVEGYKIALTFPEAWAVGAASATTWCTASGACDNWFGDDVSETNSAVSDGVTVTQSAPTTDADGRVVTEYTVLAGSTALESGSTVKWTVSSINVPLRSADPTQLVTIRVYDEAGEIVAVGQDYQFPLPAWKYDDNSVSVSLSATGIGATGVDAAVQFQNHVGAGADIVSDGKITLYFAAGITFSQATPPTLSWQEPNTITSPVGTIIHAGDATQGAIYEVSVGSAGSPLIEAGENVRFEIVGGITLSASTGTTVMKQTVSGAYGDVEAQADVVEVPPIGSAVAWNYGRLNDLSLGSTPSSLVVGFTPSSDVTNTFGSNGKVVIKASKILWDVTSSASIIASVTAGGSGAAGCETVQIQFGTNSGDATDPSSISIAFLAASGSTARICVNAGEPVEITIENKLKVNPLSPEDVTFTVTSIADSHVQSTANTGFTYGAVNRVTNVERSGSSLMVAFKMGAPMAVSTVGFLTLSSNQPTFPQQLEAVTWISGTTRLGDTSTEGLAYIVSDGEVLTDMGQYGTHLTFQFRADMTIEMGQELAFTLKGAYNDFPAGTSVAYGVTTSVAPGSNNLELSPPLNPAAPDSAKAQGWRAGPTMVVSGVDAKVTSPDTNPEEIRVNLQSAGLPSPLLIRFNKAVIASGTGGRRLLAVGDGTTIVLGGGYDTCEVVPGTVVFDVDGQGFTFESQKAGTTTGEPCVPDSSRDGTVTLVGGLVDNSSSGDSLAVVASSPTEGATQLIPTAPTEVQQTAILEGSSELTFPAGDSQVNTFVVGTVVTDISVVPGNRIGLNAPESLTVGFKPSPTGAMIHGSTISITSEQDVYVLGSEPKVLLNDVFTSCKATAVAVSSKTLQVTLLNDGSFTCAIGGGDPAEMQITDDTSADVALHASPNPGTQVAYSISTSADVGTAPFTVQYLTYGFEVVPGTSTQLVVDEALTQDDALTVKFTIHTETMDSVDSVYCVATEMGNNPGYSQIVKGQQANNLPAPAANHKDGVVDGLQSSIVLEGLDDATPYDITCIMKNGMVTSLALVGQRTIGFVQGPTDAGASPQIDRYVITVEVARSSTVACVALGADVETGLPDNEFAAAIISQSLGQDAASYGVVGSESRFELLSAEASNGEPSPDIEFLGLSEGTEYDLYCAIERGFNPVTGITHEHILSDALKITTAGFRGSLSGSGTPKDKQHSLEGTTSTDVTTRCVAVPAESLPTRPTWESVYEGTNLPAGSSIPAQKAARGGVKFTFNFYGLSPKTTYRAYCATINRVISPKADEADIEFTTMGSSGISSDPHVVGSDGQFVDFYGSSGVYTMYESESMRVTGRFGLAIAENKMLFHPSVMKAGTVVTEAGVQIGDVRMRVGLHAGGLVSVSEPMTATTFLTEDSTFNVGEVTVAWTKTTETKSFPWGTNTYSAKLTLTAGDETVTVNVAESKGYHFLDLTAVAPTTTAAGLLNRAMDAPAALATTLKAQREASFMVAPAGGNLFANAVDCASNPMLV